MRRRHPALASIDPGTSSHGARFTFSEKKIDLQKLCRVIKAWAEQWPGSRLECESLARKKFSVAHRSGDAATRTYEDLSPIFEFDSSLAGHNPRNVSKAEFYYVSFQKYV
jgi:hypothetical protein